MDSVFGSYFNEFQEFEDVVGIKIFVIFMLEKGVTEWKEKNK